MAATSSDPILRFLRFLGSIQMAMILIIACAIAMIFGTVIESRHDAEIAKALVYRTPWFWGILILIGVNLAVAVINRLPLKRHQYSFAVVHLGFILMLAGGLITSMIGYEGQLYVTEGQASSELVLWDRELVVAGGGERESLHVPTGPGLAGTRLRREGGGLPELRALDYVAKGGMEPALEAGVAADPPGLRYSVVPYHGADDDHGHAPEYQSWLIADRSRSSLHEHSIFALELLRFSDAEAYAERAAAKVASGGGYEIRVERVDQPGLVTIELPARLNEVVELGDGTTVQVTAFAEHAMVSGGGGIEDSPGGRLNPAAIVLVRRGGFEERHTAFSQHPEFLSVRGRGDAPLVQSVLLKAPEGASMSLAFRFLVDPAGQLMLQMEGPDGRQAAGPVAAGQRLPVPGQALAVVVDEYLPAARVGEIVTRFPAKSDQGSPLVLLQARLGGAEQAAWVPFGQERILELGGQQWILKYGRKRMALPFEVALEDFRIEFHPGSKREAEYASQVKVTALAGEAEPISTEISMNRTLDYLGFRLFQSSYILGQGGRPDTTVLSVNRDPGTLVVYVAFGILILGLIWYVTGDGRKKRNGLTIAASPGPGAGPPSVPTTDRNAQGSKDLETVS